MQNRLKLLQPSASMEITRIAKKIESEGNKIFPLSIGDTHFAPPKAIQEKILEGLKKEYTHYTDAFGLPELRENISKYYKSIFKIEDILITSGVKQALYYLLLASDFKILCALEPAWLGYESTCILTGKEYLSINIKKADWKQKALDSKFDALIICSPNNPDGKVFSLDELEIIKKAIEKNNAVLIIDEIYRSFMYENQINHLEFLYTLPNVVILNGFSKSHAITGLRIGYMITSNKALMSSCIKLQQNIATCASSLAQYGAISFIDATEEVNSYCTYYKKNRDLVSEIIPEFESFKPSGGFYYFVDLSIFQVKDPLRFCKLLLEKERIAVVPGDAYGKDFGSWIRISFSINREDLKIAMIKMKKFITEYSE